MVTFVGADSTGGNVTDSSTLAGAARLIWPTVDADDVAVLVWSWQNNSTATIPSGFTHEATNDVGDGGGAMRTAVYWKVCTGSEDGTVLATVIGSLSRQSACLVVYRGLDTTDPIAALAVDIDHLAETTTHTNPAVTPPVANCVIATSIHERATSIDADFTAPSGYTERADTLALATGSGGSITAVADDGLASGRGTGAVTPPVWTGDNGTGTDNIVTYSLALRSGSLDAAVNAVVVTVAASIPAPTASGGAGVTAAAVIGVTSVPSVTVSTGSRVSPAAVGAVAFVPAPAVTTGSQVAAVAVTATAAVSSVVVSTGSRVSPAVVAAVAAVPAVQVVTAGNATVTPSVVAGVAAVPAAAPSGASAVSPVVVQAAASVPAPTVRTGSTAAVAAVAALAVVPAPDVSGSAGVAPAAVLASAVVPGVVLHLSGLVAAQTVLALASVPSVVIPGSAPVRATSAGAVTAGRSSSAVVSASRSSVSTVSRG